MTRSNTTGDEIVSSSPPVAVSFPVELGRGDHLTLQATVLRFTGPWVQLQVLGETMNVLRSTLNKEITHGR